MQAGRGTTLEGFCWYLLLSSPAWWFTWNETQVTVCRRTLAGAWCRCAHFVLILSLCDTNAPSISRHVGKVKLVQTAPISPEPDNTVNLSMKMWFQSVMWKYEMLRTMENNLLIGSGWKTTTAPQMSAGNEDKKHTPSYKTSIWGEAQRFEFVVEVLDLQVSGLHHVRCLLCRYLSYGWKRLLTSKATDYSTITQ